MWHKTDPVALLSPQELSMDLGMEALRPFLLEWLEVCMFRGADNWKSKFLGYKHFTRQLIKSLSPKNFSPVKAFSVPLERIWIVAGDLMDS